MRTKKVSNKFLSVRNFPRLQNENKNSSRLQTRSSVLFLDNFSGHNLRQNTIESTELIETNLQKQPPYAIS